MTELPPPAPDGPSDGHGVPLLAPPTEAEAHRRRRERPAEIGRFLLIGLGAICASAALAFWLTSHAALVAAPLLAFGLLLVALGLTLHFVLQRDRDRWPEAAHAWEEGIELLLHDGELRAASWSDPKLALDLFVHQRPGPASDERLLVWRMDSAVPPCDLSEGGFNHLLRVVVTHDLRLTEFRRGRGSREARAYEIRARTAPSLFDPRAAPGDSRRVPP